MAKSITVSDQVMKRLNKIKDTIESDEEDKISYSDVIKVALKESNMWRLHKK